MNNKSHSDVREKLKIYQHHLPLLPILLKFSIKKPLIVTFPIGVLIKC